MRSTLVRRITWGLATIAAVAAAATLVAVRSHDHRQPPRVTTAPRNAAATEPAVARRAETDAARKLAALDAVLRSTVEAIDAPRAYWRDEARANREHVEALIAAYAHARVVLLAEFGADARTASEFRSLFQPLARTYPFLTSEQQIAVHAAELRLRAHAAPGSDGAQPIDLFERHLAQLDAEIGEAAAFEYAVRVSPLSEQIRSSGVELSETEFREAYALLAAFDGAEPDAHAYLDMRDQLRAHLGSQRFAALWSMRDPRFEVIERVGRQHGLGTERIRSAYMLVNDAQDELLAAALEPSGDVRNDGQRLRAIFDASRARLGDTIGQDAAEAITAALSLLHAPTASHR